MSIHAIAGHFRVATEERTFDMQAGSVPVLDRTLPHELEALEQSALLLTVAWSEEAMETREALGGTRVGAGRAWGRSAVQSRPMKTVQPGLKGVAEREVTPGQTAEAFGSGLVPVFATPAMVALMEAAAVHALEGGLPDDQTTVGTKLAIAHLAATPLGDRVRAEAVLTAVDGRHLTFDLSAFDSSEKIGEGQHERMIVGRDRFLARVNAKAKRQNEDRSRG